MTPEQRRAHRILHAVIPPDREGHNSARAAVAGEALITFRIATSCGTEDVVAHLLCNLMHWCDRGYTDFEYELARARGLYQEETS